MSLRLKVMPGSTLAVLSLQGYGTDVTGTKTVRYKTSAEISWTEWTGDSLPITPAHPYSTQWYYLQQHYQIVLDTLTAGQTYDFQVQVGSDSATVNGVVLTSAKSKWTLSHYDSEYYDKVEECITGLGDFITTLQSIGFSCNYDFKVAYTEGTAATEAGADSSCFTRVRYWNTVPTSDSKEWYKRTYHELRHYLGADGDAMDESTDGLLQQTNAVVECTPSYFDNEVSAPTSTTMTWYVQSGVVYSCIDNVYQFLTGSDIAHYNILKSHDRVYDYPCPSGSEWNCDIVLFFILKAMAFNDVTVYKNY